MYYRKNKKSHFLCRTLLKNSILMLSFVFALNNTTVLTNEAWASCFYKDHNNIKNCYIWSDSGTCGRGCVYTYDHGSKTVYITASGDEAKTDYGYFSTHAYEGYFPNIDNFVINGNISLGENTFTRPDMNSKYTIFSADGNMVLTNLEHHALGENATLSGNITITDSAEFGSLAFYGISLAEGAKIFCAVDNCAQKMLESCEYPNTNRKTQCRSVLSNIISNADKFEQVPAKCKVYKNKKCVECNGGYLEQEGQCVTVCRSGYKNMGGWCNRVRYTPVEAAAATSDDNTNVVTITFKK